MKAIEINTDICIGCAKCVKDCVGEKIKLVGGKAQFMYNRCIECGHCYAVCPSGAVKMNAFPDYVGEKTFDMKEIGADNFLKALKSRRTVRSFTDEAVSQEDLKKILLAGSYCPTGTNAQDVQYLILSGDKKDSAEAQAVSFFRKAKKIASPFTDYIKNMTIDDKFFFKGAPTVVLVLSKSKTDGCLASSYAELMAEALGLGVLYSGFFVAAVKFDKKLSALLALPKGLSLATCMVIGHPAVKYERIPPRKDITVINR